jgi:ADP-ribose pyrophosphatase
MPMSVELLPPDADDARLSRIRELLRDDDTLVERVELRETKWSCPIFEAERWEVTQPDGVRAERDIVLHNGGAGVCVVRDGKMCLVRQYRVALGRMSLEIPAGKIDPNEDPAICAARELTEETGLVAERLVPIAISRSAPGFTNEATRVFYAQGVSQHPASPDPDEFVDVCWVPVDEVLAAVRAGIIQDAKTVISALFAAAL